MKRDIKTIEGMKEGRVMATTIDKNADITSKLYADNDGKRFVIITIPGPRYNLYVGAYDLDDLDKLIKGVDDAREMLEGAGGDPHET